ncbi:MAG: DNA polymerase III subunit beta [Coleofasciculaceae cyanobacterium]
MKLSCSQTELNSNLSLVSRAVPSRPTHPILGNVLLKADRDSQRVLLTAFDLSLGIQTSFAALVEVGGEITLPAKLTLDIVSRLPEGEITLEDIVQKDSDMDSDSLIVTLTSASGRYQVRGMDSEEFPPLPESSGIALHLPVEVLKEGLRGSLFATSSDETKQVLTGVHLTMQQDSLEFAATDGHRLAVVETTLLKKAEVGDEVANSEDLEELELTLPARALRELERMLSMGQGSETVALQFEKGQIVFQAGEYRLTSRTLEGQYPAYGQLIPEQFERQITLDRRQLLSAVERIAVLADQKNNIVKFSIDSAKGQVDLSVEARDVGSGRESMPCEISGESIEVAFNVKYLIEGLKALATSNILMQTNEANTPVILRPLGETKMTYLIMPVQIRN